VITVILYKCYKITISIFSSTNIPKSFSAGLLSIPSAFIDTGVALTRVQDLALCLVEHGPAPPACQGSSERHLFPQVLSTASLSLVLSTDLLRVHSILLSFIGQGIKQHWSRYGPLRDTTNITTKLYVHLKNPAVPKSQVTYRSEILLALMFVGFAD